MNLIPSKLTTLMILSTIILSPINGLAQHLPTPEKKATITAFIPQINSDKKSVLSKKLKCFSGKSVVTCDGSANLKLVVGSNPGFITITNTSSITATGITFTSLPSGITAAAAQPFPPIPVCTASLLPGDSCLLWVQATAATATSPITIQGSNTQATTINVEAFNVGDSYLGGLVYKGDLDTIFLIQNKTDQQWADGNFFIPSPPDTSNGLINTLTILNYLPYAGPYAASNCNDPNSYLPASDELTEMMTLLPGNFVGNYWTSEWDETQPVNPFNAIYIDSTVPATPVTTLQTNLYHVACIQVIG